MRYMGRKPPPMLEPVSPPPPPESAEGTPEGAREWLEAQLQWCAAHPMQAISVHGVPKVCLSCWEEGRS